MHRKSIEDCRRYLQVPQALLSFHFPDSWLPLVPPFPYLYLARRAAAFQEKAVSDLEKRIERLRNEHWLVKGTLVIRQQGLPRVLEEQLQGWGNSRSKAAVASIA